MAVARYGHCVARLRRECDPVCEVPNEQYCLNPMVLDLLSAALGIIPGIDVLLKAGELRVAVERIAAMVARRVFGMDLVFASVSAANPDERCKRVR